MKGLASQSADQSALNFGVGDSVNILVTDQAGRRTGIDPNTGQVLQEIPNSFYYSDGLSDDDDEGPTTQTDHTINISNPGQGSYTVPLSGRRAGEYQLRTGIYSQDGTAQPPLLATGPTTAGSTSSHQVTFTPNAAPTLFTEAGSTRAAALDSVTLLHDPFQVVNPHNLSADQRTRVTLFASNVNLSPAEPISVVTAVAKDTQDNTYPLEVEYVGQAPKYRWLSQIVVKLPGDISSGDVLISIKVRGVQSNGVLIKIKSPGN